MQAKFKMGVPSSEESCIRHFSWKRVDGIGLTWVVQWVLWASSCTPAPDKLLLRATQHPQSGIHLRVTTSTRPTGPMAKAFGFEPKDCRFDPCVGQVVKEMSPTITGPWLLFGPSVSLTTLTVLCRHAEALEEVQHLAQATTCTPPTTGCTIIPATNCLLQREISRPEHVPKTDTT